MGDVLQFDKNRKRPDEKRPPVNTPWSLLFGGALLYFALEYVLRYVTKYTVTYALASLNCIAFLLIYKNYSVFPQLVDCYETGLLNRILFEVEYNRRAKNDDDLGVRVQTSNKSDPTMAKAIEHIMIREAVEECNFSGNILKETDTPDKHKRDILTIHMMRREYEVFDTALKTLPQREYSMIYSFIHKDMNLLEIAEDKELAYQSVKNMIGAAKKTLENRITPFFRETI